MKCVLQQSSWLLGLIIYLTVPSLGYAQTGKTVTLDWKFKEGETFWVDTQTRIDQSERLGNQMAANIVQVRTITSYTVKKVTETNYVELEAKVERTFYQNNRTADSEKMSTLYSRLQGALFRLTLGPDRQVIKLEGYTDWLMKLANVIPNTEIDRIRSLIPESDIRNAASEGFAFLPDNPVSINQTWKKKSELNLAPAGLLTYMLHYTYKGQDKGREKISIDCKENGKFTMTPNLTTPGAQSEFYLDNRTGTILFNNQTGKLEQAEHNYQTRGTILIPGSGGVPVSLLVTNKINVKQTLSSKAPVK